jgi:hypothetical protein
MVWNKKILKSKEVQVIKIGKMIIGLVLILSMALVLSYCGSKSSDSGNRHCIRRRGRQCQRRDPERNYEP